ncbi:hypothetical protein DEJ15_07490 [Curtobacterium sp. MCJR17_043]|nr:hypothetical protein [Curtobacterium sp. MCJR17_043]WIB37218.1 hypothetical protein DEJ15_07490 [Curtobacterium sp. MCJR17_043]
MTRSAAASDSSSSAAALGAVYGSVSFVIVQFGLTVGVTSMTDSGTWNRSFVVGGTVAAVRDGERHRGVRVRRRRGGFRADVCAGSGRGAEDDRGGDTEGGDAAGGEALVHGSSRSRSLQLVEQRRPRYQAADAVGERGRGVPRCVGGCG